MDPSLHPEKEYAAAAAEESSAGTSPLDAVMAAGGASA